MMFSSSLRNAVMVPLMISVSAAGAVFLARALVRIKGRSAILLVCEARAYEMLDVLTRAGANVGNTATLIDGDAAYVVVNLNWNNAEPLRVPALVFDDDRLGIMAMFDVYCSLAGNRHPDAMLVCDCWNCLMALVEHRLQRHSACDDAGDSPPLDEVGAEELFALCTLLRGKYSIDKFQVTHSRSTAMVLVVQAFPEELFKRFSGAYRRRRSMRLGLLSFVRLLCDSCPTRRIICLALVTLLSPDAIFRSLFGLQTGVNWAPLYAAEMRESLSRDASANCGVFHFVRRQLSGAPGVLAAIAVASIGPVELFYCLRNFAISYMLTDLVMSFHVSTYLALATTDYDPNDDWTLPQRILDALWQVSNSVMGELQNQLPYLLQMFLGLLVVLRFPFMAFAMWLGTQWSDFVDFLTESLYLESQYVKSHFISTAPASEYNSTSSSRHDQPSTLSPVYLLRNSASGCMDEEVTSCLSLEQTSCLPYARSKVLTPHYGLALLTLVRMESDPISTQEPCIIFLRHVSWPVAPLAFIEYVLRSTEELPLEGAMVVSLQKLQWVRTIMRNLLSSKTPAASVSYSSSVHRKEYLQNFMTLRHAGVELAAVKAIVSDVHPCRNDRQEDLVRDILRGVFRTANAMPLLLASWAALCSSDGYLKHNVLEQNDAMSHLDSIRYLFSLSPTLAGLFYEENGLSEAQVSLACTRRHLAANGSSFGCYQILEGLHSLHQKIDRPVAIPPPLEGPWSVEFRDVSFRHSERHPYILRCVSFLVEKGSFLGIVGYSGAGKTTLLRLLNRTYAPTSGDIFINGLPISHFPARMIRRRIANVWQEESKFRFLDNLSIAGNVALGNPWSSMDAHIDRALSSAQALSFLQGRSSGIYAPLYASEFSGGEVERLCIARAMMKADDLDVGLYVLDEATSAVDTQTEKNIFKALGMAGKNAVPRCATYIVVAHRLATIMDADKILILNDGIVEQLGTWEELRGGKPGSCFSNMLKSQNIPSFISPECR